MVLQAGDAEPWPIDPLARRLDAAYYALTRTTERHFGEDGDGWLLTGVAGLDAPTMNRAAVLDAPPGEVGRLVDAATRFFGDRVTTWSVVLASYHDTSRWHSELVMRGHHVTSTLDVLAREPAPLEGYVPEVPVREARADEVPLFTELLMEVFRMPRRFHAALLDMTAAWRRAGAKLYFGLDEREEPVSTTLLSFTDGVAGIYNVGTLRRARRQGHARALMARALRDARGADIVTLQVAPEGFVQQFYLDMGFSPVYHWTFYQPRLRVPFFGR
ncbi:MAG TPA: GNAT family N-acetyltransferase [Candidatus Thermoplasmatota archaeon]|nr:GNAT family N-acetyltransferase [Candidatus Thermoplasmatota archaeon]